MKRLPKLLMVLWGLVAVSCTITETTPDIFIEKIKVSMNAGETKTTVLYDEITGKYKPYWTDGDRIGVFVRKDKAYVDNNIASDPLDLKDPGATASFSVEVTAPAESCQYEFYTYYPYSPLASNDYKQVRVTIPAEQHPDNGSFDPAADILSGYPVDAEVTVTGKEATLDPLSLQFVRKTSIVRLPVPVCTGFEGINGDTYVEEIKVSFDKAVVGIANWNITDNADLTLETAGSDRTVTLKYAPETHKISDPIWLSIAPVSGVKKITFAFKVGDNAWLNATSSIDGEGLSFAAGGQKKLSVSITAAKWDLKKVTEKYLKVTENAVNWTGKYLIASGNVVCDQQTTGKWGSCSSVTFDPDGSLPATDVYDAMAFDVEPGVAPEKYCIKFRNGSFVSNKSSNFESVSSKTASLTDFTFRISENVTYVESNPGAYRVLRYNYNGGSGGLRIYDDIKVDDIFLLRRTSSFVDLVPSFGDVTGLGNVAKEGVTDGNFTIAVSDLGKNSVSVKSIDGTVVTSASVSYSSGIATVTYTVPANSGPDRNGMITLAAGASEKNIQVYQETGVVLPEISPVADRNISYEASTSRTFDVSIANVGVNEVNCEVDGTVVTGASASLKSAGVYTVIYSVTENTGLDSRNGSVTVKCSTRSSVVTVVQNINTSAVKRYVKVGSLSGVSAGKYVIVASTNTITSYLPNAKTSSSPAVATSGFAVIGDQLRTKDDSGMAWNFTGTTSSMTITSAADSENYLYNQSSNSGVRVGTTSDNWQISTHTSAGSESFYFEFKDINKNRYLGIYSNTDWRSYTSATATNYSAAEGSSKIILFKEAADSIITPPVQSVPTWLDSYEIPANNASAVTSSNTLYGGKYSHSTVDETFGDTQAAIYNTSSSMQKIVTHTFLYNSNITSNFTMLYDGNKKCALWVAYKHDAVNYADNDVGRHDEWHYDPAISQSWQPDLSNSYQNTTLSYDRGHQVASNDRQTTEAQNKQTFYYSNMTPQFSSLNQGKWGTVESTVQAAMAATTGTDVLYIVTGPLFTGTLTYTKDKNNVNCALPTGYYKCLMRCSFNGSGVMTAANGCAYIVETNSENIAATLTSIDVVESKTGFNFFANVPDAFENAAEAQTSAL